MKEWKAACPDDLKGSFSGIACPVSGSNTPIGCDALCTSLCKGDLKQVQASFALTLRPLVVNVLQ